MIELQLTDDHEALVQTVREFAQKEVAPYIKEWDEKQEAHPEVFKKMAELGLVEHAPYQGIRLTPPGEAVARQLTRAHRILERFLVDMLELPWNDVHELACKLEHYISDEIINQIYNKIGKPDSCPHGNPIDPDAHDPSFRLETAQEGKRYRVAKITDERMEFLQHLEEIGLLPGVEFDATGSSKIDSLIFLSVGGQKHTVGKVVGRHVWVVPA